MNILFFTGSRSEYGLLKNIISKCQKNKYYKSHLVVTGSHLSKKYGYSLKEIHKDKIIIKSKIFIKINSDTSSAVSIAFSELIKKLNNFLKINKYDLLILLGDRYETFAASITGYINRIPILHIHGGEKTYDSLDENYRHCISKLSNFHCVSHADYKKRLIQLGENKKNIFIVGGLGAEVISNFHFLNKKKLENDLNLKFRNKVIIVNYYPEILDIKKSLTNFKIILNTLKEFVRDVTIVFTLPSHDIENEKFTTEIKKFCNKNKNSFVFKNLGQKKYFSLLNIANLMVGNSSSGLYEMPSFGKFSINLGNRQLGRITSRSVINCPINANVLRKKIIKYIIKKDNLIKNVYYKKHTTQNILKVINKIKNKKLAVNKKFIDIIQKND